MPKPADLLQGTLDLLILKTLAREPLHGWGIAKRMLQLSNDVLSVQQGSLYPALHRLEQQGWITAEWKETQARPQRQVLPADARRPATARARARQLEAPVVGRRAAAQEGLRHSVSLLRLLRVCAPAAAIARCARTRSTPSSRASCALHFDELVAEHVAEGLSPADARRAARLGVRQRRRRSKKPAATSGADVAARSPAGRRLRPAHAAAAAGDSRPSRRCRSRWASAPTPRCSVRSTR